MISLECRRVNAQIVFMYDIVNGNANCPSVRNDITERLHALYAILIISKSKTGSWTKEFSLEFLSKYANNVNLQLLSCTTKAFQVIAKEIEAYEKQL